MRTRVRSVVLLASKYPSAPPIRGFEGYLLGFLKFYWSNPVVTTTCPRLGRKIRERMTPTTAMPQHTHSITSRPLTKAFCTDARSEVEFIWCATHLGNGAHLMMPRHPNYIWEQLAQDQLWSCVISHLDSPFAFTAINLTLPLYIQDGHHANLPVR